MRLKNGKIPLDSINVNAWGLRSSDKDSLIKSLTGSPIWVTGKKPSGHEEDENPFTQIGSITDVAYDADSNCLRASGLITDSVAESKFREGTWKQIWSPRVEGFKSADGFVASPTVKGLTIVDNPAWDDATFEINDTPLYAFVGDDSTPPEEVVEKKHPLKINNPTSDDTEEEDDDDDESEVTMERAPQRVKTIQPREVKATKKLDFVSRDDFDELKALITSMTQNTIKPATEPTTEPAPATPSGLGVDDVLKILAAREEKKAHTDAVEEYINISKSKGIEVNPDDLKAFNKLKSDEVKIFTKQMGSVQAKSVFNSAPSYLNVATGESHMKSSSESGLTVGVWNADTNSWDV